MTHFYKPLLLLLLALMSFWAANLYDPHLLAYRPYEVRSLLTGLLVLAFFASLQRQKYWRYALLLGVLGLYAWVGLQEQGFQQQKHQVLTAAPLQHLAIHQRFIVGFTDVEQIKQLARLGIAGVFLTRRNIEGKSLADIRTLLDELQQIRQRASLAPLFIATDQEGGVVSRLSPPLPLQAPLNELMALPPAARAKTAFAYGTKQGAGLKAVGINLNFSPVVDLKPQQPRDALDFHTQIDSRALADNPEDVYKLAKPYIQGLAQQGVIATLKHFPGLGSVSADTHHFAAHLDLAPEILMQSDWRPFMRLGQETDAWLMLSHVILTQVDAKRPVSTSAKGVKLLRQKLQFKGKLITDDLTMGATYNRGFCLSVSEAYQSGIDYLLIAYDVEKYYLAMACVSDE